MSKEDDLVNSLIEFERSISTWESEIEPEAHYDYYGTRGVADLYVQRKPDVGPRRDLVYEIKSDAAVKNASGANEIIRQYNRMREAFYKDDSRKRPRRVGMELVFTITPAAVFHVAENILMYAATSKSSVLDDFGELSSTSQVCFRLLDNPDAYIPLENLDGEPPNTVVEWVDFINSLDWETESGPSRILAILDDRYELDV